MRRGAVAFMVQVGLLTCHPGVAPADVADVVLTQPSPDRIEASFAGIPFVFCPAGTFMMGRTPGEEGSYVNEDPQHPVTFAQGFWMSKYEITQAQWRAVTGDNPSHFQGANAGGENTDQRPVEQVSWNDIAGPGGFLEKLNAANPGMNFRLPSEAEWEYACRAGAATRFYWGDDPDYTQTDAHAWRSGNSNGQTHNVGGKEPNAWGLFDMSGNVWEWVQDWYHSSYSGAPGDGSAWESPPGVLRVMRGGGWFSSSTFCLSAYRVNDLPDKRLYSVGCRLCRPLQGR